MPQANSARPCVGRVDGVLREEWLVHSMAMVTQWKQLGQRH